jgi:hypothetical protein
VQYQEPPAGFDGQNMSANFIVNFVPLVIVYGLYLLVGLVVYMLPENMENPIALWIKKHFIKNGYYLIFLLTMQEEFLYVML